MEAQLVRWTEAGKQKHSPESRAMDFGGGTGWKTMGKIAPDSWLSTCIEGAHQS